jgi:hypothetical protein
MDHKINLLKKNIVICENNKKYMWKNIITNYANYNDIFYWHILAFRVSNDFSSSMIETVPEGVDCPGNPSAYPKNDVDQQMKQPIIA